IAFAGRLIRRLPFPIRSLLYLEQQPRFLPRRFWLQRPPSFSIRASSSTCVVHMLVKYVSLLMSSLEWLFDCLLTSILILAYKRLQLHTLFFRYMAEMVESCHF